MTVTAGQRIIAGKMPGERIATDTDTANSGAVTTTEVSCQEVTAPLVSGRLYRIRWASQINSTVADDTVISRIREDSGIAGTQLFGTHTEIGAANLGQPVVIEAEYTALATGDQTFSGTLIRNSGSGNVARVAGSTAPSLLYVEYVSG